MALHTMGTQQYDTEEGKHKYISTLLWGGLHTSGGNNWLGDETTVNNNLDVTKDLKVEGVADITNINGNLTVAGNLTANGETSLKKGAIISGRISHRNKNVLWLKSPVSGVHDTHFYHSDGTTWISGKNIYARRPDETSNDLSDY
jgi:hypothetical protein